MSLVENLKGRATKTPLPAEIENDLRLAESTLADLEASHGGAALDAIGHVAGADAALRDLEQRLASQRQKVATLRAAHRASMQREADAAEAQRASIQKAQRAACARHLRDRDAAAVALAKALADAAEQYHVLLDRSAKAHAACPALSKWPDASLCGHTDLRRLVVNEMYRVSAAPGDKGQRALPGAEPSGSDTQWNPEAIKPLVDQVKGASAFIASKLKAPE